MDTAHDDGSSYQVKRTRAYGGSGRTGSGRRGDAAMSDPKAIRTDIRSSATGDVRCRVVLVERFWSVRPVCYIPRFVTTEMVTDDAGRTMTTPMERTRIQCHVTK